MNSPGVQMTEMDYSDYVQSSSEITVGCLGGARRGPLSPTLITSQEELIKIYGEPVPNDYGLYGAYMALTQVTQLYFQRVIASGTPASAGTPGTDKVTFTMIAKDSHFNNYKIKIDQEGKPVSTPVDGEFSVTLLTSDGLVVETFENLVIDSGDIRYISKIINSQSNYFTVRVNDTGSLKTGTLMMIGGEAGSSSAYAGVEGDEFIFRSRYPDSTINDCKIEVTTADSFGYFDVTVSDPSTGSVIEAYSNMTLDESDDRYLPRFVNNSSDRILVSYNPEGAHKSVYVFAGGSDGIKDITDADIIGNATDNSGLQAFNNPETLDMNLLIIPGVTSDAVVSAAVELCEKRGDTLYIVDTPFGLTAKRANDWVNGTGTFLNKYILNSSYAAVYWSWIKVNDPFTKENIYLPPSGKVVAQMAYSDNQSYPWFAPAGLKRGIIQGVLDVETSPTQEERDLIYGKRNCVNPIVKFTGTGITIWGQKTTQRKCSALDRVNVRRLLNWLKKSIGMATKYYVFDPNDPVTWDEWTDKVEKALNTVKTARGIYDLKVTMRPTDQEIENNQMPGIIKIKPTKSAEFIPLGFMIMPYGVDFSEEEVK